MDTNYTIQIPPELLFIARTILSIFCCIVGSWIILVQWWIEIWSYVCHVKGWPIRSYSLAPGGGVLLALGIYFIPVPQNYCIWVGEATSLIQPYWWIPLLIDPFHIIAVLCVTILTLSRLYHWHFKCISKVTSSPDREKKAEHLNKQNQNE